MYTDDLGYSKSRSKIKVHGFILSTVTRRVQFWLY